MPITGASILIDSPSDGDEILAVLHRLTADGPFVPTAVEHVGGGRRRCTFTLRRPGMVVGFASVIELQHRLDRAVEIVSVERDAPARDLHEVAVA